MAKYKSTLQWEYRPDDFGQGQLILIRKCQKIGRPAGKVFGNRVNQVIDQRLIDAVRQCPPARTQVGYMMAQGKPVCLLKDQTLKNLHTDLVGRLYEPFDPQNAATSIPVVLEKWLKNKRFAM